MPSDAAKIDTNPNRKRGTQPITSLALRVSVTSPKTDEVGRKWHNRQASTRNLCLLRCVVLTYSLCAATAVAWEQPTAPAAGPAAQSDRAAPVELPDASAPTPPEQASRRADQAAPASPFPVPRAGKVALWRLPLQKLVVHSQKEDAVKPVWVFESGPPERRSFVRQVADKQGALHDAVAVFSFRSWRVFSGRVQTALVEFPLRLPEGAPVQLRAVMAFSDASGEGERQSGPVAWRVRVLPFEAPPEELGQLIFEWESDAAAWQEVIVDLSDWAGRAIWLQLVVLPRRGARHAYWVEPTLIAGHLGDRQATLIPAAPSAARETVPTPSGKCSPRGTAHTDRP